MVGMITDSRVFILFYYEMKGLYNAVFNNPAMYFVAAAVLFFLMSWIAQSVIFTGFLIDSFLPDDFEIAALTPVVAHLLTLIFIQRLIIGFTRKGLLQQVSASDFDYLFPSPASYREIYIALKLKDEFLSSLVFMFLLAPPCAGFILGIGTPFNPLLTVVIVLLVFWLFLFLTGVIKDLIFFYVLDTSNEIINYFLKILRLSRWLALAIIIAAIITLTGIFAGVIAVIGPLINLLLSMEMLLPSGMTALIIEGLLSNNMAIWNSILIVPLVLLAITCFLLAIRAADKHYLEHLMLEKTTAIKGAGRIGFKIQRTYFSMDLAKGSPFSMIVKKDLLLIQRVYRRLLFQVFLLPIVFFIMFIFFFSLEGDTELAYNPLLIRSTVSYALLFIPAVPLVLVGLESTSFYLLKSSNYHGMDFALGKFTVAMVVMLPPILLLSTLVATVFSDGFLVILAISATAMANAIYTAVGCWRPPWNARSETPASLITTAVSTLILFAAYVPLLLLSQVNPSGVPVYVLAIIVISLLLAERFYNRLLEFA